VLVAWIAERWLEGLGAASGESRVTMALLMPVCVIPANSLTLHELDPRCFAGTRAEAHVMRRNCGPLTCRPCESEVTRVPLESATPGQIPHHTYHAPAWLTPPLVPPTAIRTPPKLTP
jgi:hypothetical protein